MGAAPGTLRELRRQTAEAAGIGGSKRCLTSTIAIAFGEDKDPATEIPIRIVTNWLRMWEEATDQQKKKIRKAWARQLPKLLHKRPWSRVVGPMGATIATLASIGWKPAAPDKWKRGEGWWVIVPGGSTLEMIAEIREDVQSELWLEASGHWAGGGLEGGVDWATPKRYLRWLYRKGRAQEAGTMKAIIAGGMWPPARKVQAGMATDPTCRRCGADCDDDDHLIWTCCARGPENDQEPKKREKAENKDRREWKAADQKYNAPCFWNRGMMPKAWTKLDPPSNSGFHDEYHNEHHNNEHRQEEGQQWEGGWYFSDGSGGRNTKDPRRRRCGWSIAQLQGHSQSQYERGERTEEPEIRRAAWGTLPGERQTVPRAELQAVIELLERTAETTDKVTLWVDCEYVRSGMQKVKRMAGAGASNQDQWQKVLELRNERRGLFVVRRVWRSHVTGDDIAAGCISRSHATGNTAADELAKEGAAMHEITPEEDKSIEELDKLNWTVLHRITRRYTELFEQTAPPLQPKAKEERLQPPWQRKRAKLQRKGHNMVRRGRGNGWRCTGCNRGARGKGLAAWAEEEEECTMIFDLTEQIYPQKRAEHCNHDHSGESQPSTYQDHRQINAQDRQREDPHNYDEEERSPHQHHEARPGGAASSTLTAPPRNGCREEAPEQGSNHHSGESSQGRHRDDPHNKDDEDRWHHQLHEAPPGGAAVVPQEAQAAQATAHTAGPAELRFGTLVVHNTHREMYALNDIIYCGSCGGWGRQRIVKLVKPCPGHKLTSTAGKAARKRLEAGRPPVKEISWTAAQRKQQAVPICRQRGGTNSGNRSGHSAIAPAEVRKMEAEKFPAHPDCPREESRAAAQQAEASEAAEEVRRERGGGNSSGNRSGQGAIAPADAEMFDEAWEGPRPRPRH